MPGYKQSHRGTYINSLSEKWLYCEGLAQDLLRAMSVSKTISPSFSCLMIEISKMMRLRLWQNCEAPAVCSIFSVKICSL